MVKMKASELIEEIVTDNDDRLSRLYIAVCVRLDDVVEKVLTVCQGADVTLKVENGRQKAAFHVCADLLDAATEHYENLTLLRNELRKRDNLQKQFPPAIDYSTSTI